MSILRSLAFSTSTKSTTKGADTNGVETGTLTPTVSPGPGSSGIGLGGQGGLAGVDLDPPAIEGIFLEPESPKGLATGVARTPHSASPLRVGPEPSRTGGNPSLEGATGGFSLVPLGDGAGGSEESESTSAGGRLSQGGHPGRWAWRGKLLSRLGTGAGRCAQCRGPGSPPKW